MRSFAELERHCMRFQERVLTRLRVRYGTTTIDRAADAQNVSEGGLYIVTNDVYKVGSRLKLIVDFPDRPFHHICEVMWAIRVPEHLKDSLVHGMGVQFIKPAPTWFGFFREWKERALNARR